MSEEPKAPSFISKLFPPPPTLIKETLSRYKPQEPEPSAEEGEIFIKEEKISFDETHYDHPTHGETTKDTEEETPEE